MATLSTHSLLHCRTHAWLEQHCLDPLLFARYTCAEAFHGIVSVRVAHVVLVPFTLLGNLGHFGVGLCCGAVALLTLGCFPSVTAVASEQLKQGSCILSDAYAHLLCAVKPSAQFVLPGDNLALSPARLTPPQGVMRYHCMTSMNSELESVQGTCARRAIIAKALALLILANLADCVIACIAVPVSFIFLGHSSPLNGVAYHTLGAPFALLNDIWKCSVYLCNPNSRTS